LQTTPRGIAYSVTGSGPPLLWLGGYAIAASSLKQVVQRFAQRFTCIVFDHRGSGLSRPSCGPMTTPSMAKDALNVLHYAGYESAHVIGVSLGGMVAQELAIRHPHRVRTLVLAATTAGGLSAAAPGAATLVRELQHAYSAFPGSWSVSMRGLLYQAWAAATHDTAARAQRITMPTLIIHGEQDPLVPLANARILASAIPGSEFYLVRGAGHIFLFDTDEAVPRVLDWLNERRRSQAPLRPVRRKRLDDVFESPFRSAVAQFLPVRRSARAVFGCLSNAGRELAGLLAAHDLNAVPPSEVARES
jgi:pimeloyl-ACP methyl ester carboxylesterase